MELNPSSRTTPVLSGRVPESVSSHADALPREAPQGGKKKVERPLAGSKPSGAFNCIHRPGIEPGFQVDIRNGDCCVPEGGWET